MKKAVDVVRILAGKLGWSTEGWVKVGKIVDVRDEGWNLPLWGRTGEGRGNEMVSRELTMYKLVV